MAIASQPVDLFERAIVLRVSRGAFFVVAALAALAVVVGAGAFVGGIVRLPVAKPDVPPAVPAPPPVGLGDAQQLLAAAAVRALPSGQHSAQATQQPEANTAGWTPPPPPPPDPMASALQRLMAQFPAPTYSWDDIVETRCAHAIGGTCIQRERRITTEGVVRSYRETMRWVPRADRVDVVNLMASLLGGAPPEGRERLLKPIAELYVRRRGEHDARVREREEKIARDRAAYEVQVVAQQASKERFREFGYLAALGGVGGLVLVGLFLAQLATERHLRLLERLVAASTASVPGSEAKS